MMLGKSTRLEIEGSRPYSGDVDAVRTLGQRYQELQEAGDRLLEEWVAPGSDR